MATVIVGLAVLAGSVGVVTVGATAVVGTGIVVGGAYGTHKLYKHRKKRRKTQAKKWKHDFLAAHPECKKRVVPKIPKHIGPTLNLANVAGYSIGLGWDSKVPTNADLVAVAYDKAGNILGAVSGCEGNKLFASPAMIHSGDCREGGKESRESGQYDDNENIIINFQALPANVATIVIGVIYDRIEGEELKHLIHDSYVNGLPIYQFMSAEEFEMKRQAIEAKETKLRINLSKEPDVPEPEASPEGHIGEKKAPPEMPPEEEPAHAFTISINKLAQCNSFIPGKFAKLNEQWVYQPIQIPVEAENIDQLGEIMGDFTPTSVAIPNWGSKPFTITIEDVSSSDYSCNVVTFDRWNQVKIDRDREVITPGFDTFLVLEWKTDPRPCKYMLCMMDDPSKRVSCENEGNSKVQLLCRISRSRPFQRGEWHLPFSKNCYLDFFNKPMDDANNLELFLKNQFSIRNEIKILRVTVSRGYDLPAKDLNGYSDPFIKVRWSKGSLKSKTIKKCLNPVWDFSFTIDTAVADAEKIKLTVYDEDLVSNDKIGTYVLDIQKITVPFSEPVVLKGTRKGAIHITVQPTDQHEAKHLTYR